MTAPTIEELEHEWNQLEDAARRAAAAAKAAKLRYTQALVAKSEKRDAAFASASR